MFLKPTLVAFNRHTNGLGNRVRVTLGAKSLAEFTGRDLFVVWPTTRWFQPRIDQLWQTSVRTMPRAASRLLAIRYPYVGADVEELVRNHPDRWLWQIRTGSDLVTPEGVTPWRDEFRALRPIPEVTSRINALAGLLPKGKPYVGVMIRAHRVSHERTLAASPVEWFIDRMRTIVEARGETAFYVSSDVPEVQDLVASSVPGVVHQRNKGAYNSVRGVQSAIADLYLLASSSYLIGPHYSSFIDLASDLAPDVNVEDSTSEGPADISDLLLPPARDATRPSQR